MSTAPFGIVVIGTSAGGVEALQQLVSDLPEDINAAIFIVLHLPAGARSSLATILQRCSRLPVRQAQDGAIIQPRSIVVARPDYHLLLSNDKVRLTRGPKENRHRPAVDVLFRSAAQAYGSRVTGVILTGALDDGTAGLWSIRDRSGRAIIQDPSDACFPSMPASALEYAGADHVLPLAQLGALLTQLTNGASRPMDKPVSESLETELRIAEEVNGLTAGVMNLGDGTPYTCPECHGALVQLKEGPLPRFRCPTGHAYSMNNLLAETTEYVEDSLWNALRSIEESAMLLRHVAEHLRTSRNAPHDAERFESKAEQTLRRADIVRRAALEHQTLSCDNIAQVNEGSR